MFRPSPSRHLVLILLVVVQLLPTWAVLAQGIVIPGEKQKPGAQQYTADQQAYLVEKAKVYAKIDALKGTNLNAARDMAFKVLELDRSVFGDKSLQAADTLAILADLSWSANDKKTAMTAKAELANIYKEVFGKDDYRALEALWIAIQWEVTGSNTNAATQQAQADTLIAEARKLIAAARPAEGLALAEKAYGILKQIYAKDPEIPMCAVALNLVGRAQQELSRFPEAAATYDRVIAIYRRCYGEASPSLAVVLVNRANVTGDIAQQEQYYRQVVEQYEKAKLPDTSSLRSALLGLTTTAYNAGRPAQAKEFVDRAIQLETEAAGAESPGVMSLRAMRARCINALGQHEEAEAEFKKLIAYFDAADPKWIADRVAVHDELGVVYAQQAKWDLAEKQYRIALDLEEKRGGEKGYRYATQLARLGSIDYFSKKYAAAATTYEKVVKLMSAMLDPGSPELERHAFMLAASLRMRAAELNAQGKRADARKQLRHAVDVALPVMGPDRPESKRLTTALALQELVDTLPAEQVKVVLDAEALVSEADEAYRAGQLAEAEVSLRQAIELQDTLGDKLPRLIRAENLGVLGAYLKLQSKYAESIEYFKAARADFELIFQGEKPSLEYANVIGFLGEVSEKLQAWGDAAKYYNSAIDAYRRLDGDLANKAAYTLPSLARCYLALGSYDQGLTIHRQHVDEMQRIFGKNSYPYADAVYQLAKAEFGVSNFKLASELFSQAIDLLKAREPEADKLYEYRQWVIACDIRLGNTDAAIAALEQSLLEARESNSPYGIKYAGVELIILYRSKSRYEEAEKLAEEIMAMASEKLADDPAALQQVWEELAVFWNDKILLFERERKFGESIPLREKYLAKQTEIYGPDHRSLVGLRQQLSAARKIAALPADQQQQYLDAQKLLNQGNPDPDEALAAAELVHELLGDKSIVVAVAYLQAAKSVPAGSDMGEPAFQKALQECAASLGDDSFTAGEIHQAFGEYLNLSSAFRKGVDELNRALEIYSKHASIAGMKMAETKTYLAVAHLNFGELGLATRYLNEAEPILLAKQNKSEAVKYYTLGLSVRSSIAGHLGDLEERLRLSQLALDQNVQHFGARSLSAAVYHGFVGDAYGDLGKLDEARRSYQLASEIMRELGMENSVQFAVELHGLANVENRSGNSAEAIRLLKQASELFAAHLGESNIRYREQLVELCHAQRVIGNLAEAEVTARKALAANKEHSGTSSNLYANTLQELVEILHKQKKFSEAADLLEESLDSRERMILSASHYRTEAQQASIMRDARRQLGRLMNYTLNEPERLTAAYDHLLWLKGSIFARQRRLRELRDNPAAAELFTRWTNVTGALATLAMRPPYAEDRTIWSRRLALLSADKDAIERELLGLAGEKAHPAVTFDQVRAALPEKSALIDFFAFDSTGGQGSDPSALTQNLRAFVIRPDRKSVVQVDIQDVARLNELVDRWREALDWTKSDAFKEAEQKEDEEALQELFAQSQKTQIETSTAIKQLLWEPLEKEIGGVEQVILSPDGPLGKFPLVALPGKQQHTYLIEDLMISSIAVPALLPELMAKNSQGEVESLLLLGDVNYGGSAGIAATRAPDLAGEQRGWLPYSFSPLEGVRPEMNDIAASFAKVFPQGKEDLFVESEASENIFRREAPLHRWLHLATHGFYEPELAKDAEESRLKAQVLSGQADGNAADYSAVLNHEGLKSGLALAGANEFNREGEDDGILSAMEVSAMDLSHVEMAMLSACQTGLGESLSGEGVAGLQRAFQVAGVRSTVTSLWSVDDTAARLLAARFYRNLWEKKMSKAAAMREAQSWMIAAAYRDDGKNEVPEELTIDSEVLPGRFRLPECWAPFVLSGDWR